MNAPTDFMFYEHMPLKTKENNFLNKLLKKKDVLILFSRSFWEIILIGLNIK